MFSYIRNKYTCQLVITKKHVFQYFIFIEYDAFIFNCLCLA